jgi:hypothetical protein
MSIAQQLAERTETADKRAAKGEFLKLAHMLLKYGDSFNAAARAEAERAAPRIKSILQKLRSLAAR